MEQQLAPPPAPSPHLPRLQELGREIDSPFLQRLMTNFWFDKFCGLALALQAGIWIYDAIQNQRGLQLILLLVSHGLFLGFALVRTTPKRVTTNPVYWLIELIAALSWVFYGVFRNDPAPAVAPDWLTQGIAVLATCTLIAARVSLARSFGYLPAQREIVSRGAYALVRHPIYTGLLLHGVAYLLSHFDMKTLAIVLVGNFFFLMKALIEEAYLSRSPEYRDYLQEVRWRYIPFVF
jgi:protein-S-isoprenylcysteine O-methyltransferase Ste14